MGRRGSEVEQLFDEAYVPLRRLAYLILGDAHAAEEVVQEAFVKVCSRWDIFGRAEHKPSYLRTTVVNLCRSKLRRMKIETRVNALVQRGEQGSVSHDVESRLDTWAAVRALPDRARLAVVLRYYEDLPESEIAQLMECSVGTVKSQLSRARARLEGELSDQKEGGTR